MKSDFLVQTCVRHAQVQKTVINNQFDSGFSVIVKET